MLFQIDVMSRTPVYEQFINQVETYLLTGILREGDKLPSVRNLAVELSINPNTVQKAMIELDRRGVITAVPGKGSYIAEGALEGVRDARRKKGLSEVRELLNELKLSGITKEEMLALVEEIYHGQSAGGADESEKVDGDEKAGSAAGDKTWQKQSGNRTMLDRDGLGKSCCSVVSRSYMSCGMATGVSTGTDRIYSERNPESGNTKRQEENRNVGGPIEGGLR